MDARHGKPATVRETMEGDEPGVLRIAFRDDHDLAVIDWDRFFGKFEEEGLAFLYQERTRDGSRSRFFKFVERDD